MKTPPMKILDRRRVTTTAAPPDPVEGLSLDELHHLASDLNASLPARETAVRRLTDRRALEKLRESDWSNLVKLAAEERLTELDSRPRPTWWNRITDRYQAFVQRKDDEPELRKAIRDVERRGREVFDAAQCHDVDPDALRSALQRREQRLRRLVILYCVSFLGSIPAAGIVIAAFAWPTVVGVGIIVLGLASAFFFAHLADRQDD